MTMNAMNPYKSNQITRLQFILMVHGMQMGVGVIAMPSQLAKTSGTDGWIAIIIGWLASILASLIIIQVMKRHPDGTILQLLTHYFGKWVGKMGAVIFACYMATLAYLVFDRMVLLIRTWIMQNTQGYILMLLFIIPAYMLAIGGMRSLGRFAEVVLLCTLWMPFFLLLLLKDAHWIHLLPVLKEGWMPVWHGVSSTVISFLGFESAFFLYPYLDNKKSASANIIIANTLTFLVYLFITILCFILYSPDEITQFNEAALSVIKVVEFRFIERFDIIVLTIYVLIICRTWVPELYIFTLCTEQLVLKGKTRLHLIVLLFVMVILTYIMDPSWNQSVSWFKISGYFGFGVAYLFPICLWVLLSVTSRIARWRK